MLSTLLAVVTIDRLGRRIGLWWGAVGQGIALILAGAFARLLKDNPDKAAQYGGAAAFSGWSLSRRENAPARMSEMPWPTAPHQRPTRRPRRSMVTTASRVLNMYVIYWEEQKEKGEKDGLSMCRV